MFKKFTAVILSLLLILTALSACGKTEKEDYGDPNANASIPSDSIGITISQKDNGKTITAVGAECDPHFLFGNVGHTMTDNITGEEVEIKAEHWSEIFEPRIKDMDIEYLRVMLLPSWYALEESMYLNKEYTYDSEAMKSLYQVLDTAQKYDIEVNLVMWLWDCNYYKQSLANDDPNDDDSEWTLPSLGKGEQVFAEVFADGLDYLINTKGYTCIKEITPVNEPNSTFRSSFDEVTGFDNYVSLCRKVHEVFQDRGLRRKVKFNLSDDAREPLWLEMTLEELKGVYDIVNSHSYDFDERNSNEEIATGNAFYNYKKYTDLADKYQVPHMFGEFGTNNMDAETNWTKPIRGLEIARIALNMLDVGSTGFSYWMLFGQYYSWEPDDVVGNNDDFGNNMGLWGAIHERYECRPVYYAYSMLTRFVKKGARIYLCENDDPNIVAVAVRLGDNWSYLIVNNSVQDKKVSFLNHAKFPTAMQRYVYDMANVPTDNKVIQSGGNLTPNGRVLTDIVKSNSFVVYTSLEGGK